MTSIRELISLGREQQALEPESEDQQCLTLVFAFAKR